MKMRSFYVKMICHDTNQNKENNLMKKSNTIIDIMQVLLTKEEVKEVCDALEYKDASRKFTVYSLIKFFCIGNYW